MFAYYVKRMPMEFQRRYPAGESPIQSSGLPVELEECPAGTGLRYRFGNLLAGQPGRPGTPEQNRAYRADMC